MAAKKIRANAVVSAEVLSDKRIKLTGIKAGPAGGNIEKIFNPQLASLLNRATAQDYGSGSLTVKVLPAPGWLETSMEPPWASTMALQMARPRPVPPRWLERALSTR